VSAGAIKQMPVRTYLDTTVVPVLRQVRASFQVVLHSIAHEALNIPVKGL
jgi:hypothetical protein